VTRETLVLNINAWISTGFRDTRDWEAYCLQRSHCDHTPLWSHFPMSGRFRVIHMAFSISMVVGPWFENHVSHAPYKQETQHAIDTTGHTECHEAVSCRSGRFAKVSCYLNPNLSTWHAIARPILHCKECNNTYTSKKAHRMVCGRKKVTCLYPVSNTGQFREPIVLLREDGQFKCIRCGKRYKKDQNMKVCIISWISSIKLSY
jgi:hypothetical protein